jgi:hypothetical protein
MPSLRVKNSCGQGDISYCVRAFEGESSLGLHENVLVKEYRRMLHPHRDCSRCMTFSKNHGIACERRFIPTWS